MTTESAYIFDGTSDTSELRRLRLLESVFDEKTRQWLLRAGTLEKRRCLEVGAGAGSIAAWLAAEVGPQGSVTAVDTNVRYLGGLGSRVEVVEGAVGAVSIPDSAFDVAHARYVLVHNVDALAILRDMLAALEPGGALVVEEPDFSVAAPLLGPAALKESFARVAQAVKVMFAERGLSWAFGRSLPELVSAAGAAVVEVDYDCPASSGGSALAEMMGLSTLSLRDKYMTTGQATAGDVAGYGEFAASPECWGIYYATVRVFARKPV